LQKTIFKAQNVLTKFVFSLELQAFQIYKVLFIKVLPEKPELSDSLWKIAQFRK